MKNFRKFFAGFTVAAVCLVIGGVMLMTVKPMEETNIVEAEEKVAVTLSGKQETPENPIYREREDRTEWSYVWFGTYPQKEITGEELTAEIVDASYDKYGDTLVNGEKYRRLSQKEVKKNANRKKSYFDWSAGGYHYFKYEPVKWRVLTVVEGNMILFSDMGIDCQQYHAEHKEVTWENSSLRAWLNGQDLQKGSKNFIHTAFTNDEQKDLLIVDVLNLKNPETGTEAGSSTEDKVYLLARGSASNDKFGFSDNFKSKTSTRCIQPSEYAWAMGAWKSPLSGEKGNGWWWLRSPGSISSQVSLVGSQGSISSEGYTSNGYYGLICPVVKIPLSSPYWSNAQKAEE